MVTRQTFLIALTHDLSASPFGLELNIHDELIYKLEFSHQLFYSNDDVVELFSGSPPIHRLGWYINDLLHRSVQITSTITQQLPLGVLGRIILRLPDDWRVEKTLLPRRRFILVQFPQFFRGLRLVGRFVQLVSLLLGWITLHIFKSSMVTTVIHLGSVLGSWIVRMLPLLAVWRGVIRPYYH